MPTSEQENLKLGSRFSSIISNIKMEAHDEAAGKIKSLLRDFPGGDDIQKTLERLATHIGSTDELYPIVKDKLIGSGLDAKLVKKILYLSSKTAKRINATAKDFVLRDKIEALKRTHKSELARHLATEYASGDFCYAPTFEFFYGAIHQEGLVLKPRLKRARVDLTQRNVTQTQATERDIHADCEQDSTPKEVEAIYKKVRTLVERKPKGADFLSAMIEPESFPRTIENLFHFAFLVRDGRVGVEEKSKQPVIKLREQAEPRGSWNQSILSFSASDYRRWQRKNRQSQ